MGNGLQGAKVEAGRLRRRVWYLITMERTVPSKSHLSLSFWLLLLACRTTLGELLNLSDLPSL